MHAEMMNMKLDKIVMCAEHEIRNYCSQNHAEHEIRNYCLQNHAEHEIWQNRAEHEIRNYCLQNHAEQVSNSIMPSIIDEVLNLMKIVMGSLPCMMKRQTQNLELHYPK